MIHTRSERHLLELDSCRPNGTMEENGSLSLQEPILVLPTSCNRYGTTKERIDVEWTIISQELELDPLRMQVDSPC